MGYIEGFVAAVPAKNKQAFAEHAADAAGLFKEFGVARIAETWGDDVPDGKVTDFKRAVQAEPDEVVAFSWLEYPGKPARDAASEKMIGDPRMREIGAAMPFDGKRMIYGGFVPLVDEGAGGKPGYADGFLVPVPAGKKDAYRDMAQKAAELFMKHGAMRVVEAWGDDLQDGKVTDFKRAVQAESGENVVFAWTEWPSKEVRDAGWQKVMADPSMQPDMANMPFDGKRMIYGGFEVVLDV